MNKKSTSLLGVFFLSCFLLNFPLLSIFRKMHWWGKIPALYAYIFTVWLILIVVIWYIVEGDAVAPPQSAPKKIEK
jgi:hypothetical protein